jgi:D-glycero-D-manno-heptose 1,7-bisphosphate phosphatase
MKDSEIEQALKVVELPVLTGSEKQIAWAQSIRQGELRSARQHIAENWKGNVPYSYQDVYLRAFQNVSSAKWWIEHRNMNLSESVVYQLQKASSELDQEHKPSRGPITPKLILFDLNGTLATSFTDNKPVELLPDRKKQIAVLQTKKYLKLGIITNQGGVAFGFATEEQATAEVKGIADELGIDYYLISFGHPKPKEGYERYGTPEMIARRKPAPGMLLEAMEHFGTTPEETVFVGDMQDDKDAASAAGCHFRWVDDFFRQVKISE